jgi:hypothetical protein
VLLLHLRVLSAQIQQPCAFYVEAVVFCWSCAYFFWFDEQVPKNVVAVTSQRPKNALVRCLFDVTKYAIDSIVVIMINYAFCEVGTKFLNKI